MRYRSLLFLLFTLFSLAACKTNKNKFTVIGELANMPGQTVMLEEIGINEIRVIDSAKSDAKGHFEVSGSTPEDNLYRLRFNGNRFILLAIDKGNVKVTGDWNSFENYDVAGSAGSSSMKKFITTVREHLRDINTMSIIMDSLRAKGNDSLSATAEKDMNDFKFKFTRFIEMYADTSKFFPVAIFAAQMLNPMVEKEFLASFTDGLSKRFPQATHVKEFEARLNKMLAESGQAAPAEASSGPAEGSPAPDIDLATPAGKKASLSSLKGKYVLLDFWASWCAPCRHENPNVVAAYNKFKSKNFTVFSVSLDSDKDKWAEAIAHDKLEWTHVSDLQGWQSPVAATYGVQSIPSNFLIDPSGKIIAHDLRGDDLDAKLEEVLK